MGSVALDKLRHHLHVVVDQDQDLAAGLVDRGVPRRGPAALRAVDRPQRKRRLEVRQHLSRVVRRSVDGDDELEGTRWDRLLGERFEQAAKRRGSLMGGNDDADGWRWHLHLGSLASGGDAPFDPGALPILTSVEHVTEARPVAGGISQAGGPETIRLQPTRGFSRVLAPRELWRYREVALQLAVRDITVRYRQTALGAAWAVLQPIAFMVVFTLIFGHLAGISSQGLPYALFTLAALVPWTFFANAVVLGSDSLVANTALVAKIYFPRIFIPAGVIAAGLLDLAISLVIFFIIVLAWGEVPAVTALLLPLLVLITVVTALGVSTALSAINVRYRDVRYVVPFAIQLWLFMTPVAYSSTDVSEPWRTLSAINPMTGVVEGFRWAALGADNDCGILIGISAISAAVIVIAGLAYFDRVERNFADVI